MNNTFDDRLKHAMTPEELEVLKNIREYIWDQIWNKSTISIYTLTDLKGFLLMPVSSSLV